MSIQDEIRRSNKLGRDYWNNELLLTIDRKRLSQRESFLFFKRGMGERPYGFSFPSLSLKIMDLRPMGGHFLGISPEKMRKRRNADSDGSKPERSTKDSGRHQKEIFYGARQKKGEKMSGKSSTVLSRLARDFQGGRPFGLPAIRLAKANGAWIDPKVFGITEDHFDSTGRVEIRRDPVTGRLVGATAYAN